MRSPRSALSLGVLCGLFSGVGGVVGGGSLAALQPSTAAAAPLHTEGRQFVDATGGVVLLRGVNLSGESKVPPFRHLRTAADLDPLPGWGINVLRLLFNWEAYEPTAGTYDAAYLDSVTQVVDAAHRRGLYVIVDVHQDAFSRFSTGGCGDGLPRWAVPRDIAPRTPDNGPACAGWGSRMIFDAEMHRSFSAFHANRDGVRDRYLQLLGKIARHFASHPAVIGIDPINEPWGDEKTELSALYADAERAIRREFPAAILFLGAHALTSSGLVGSALPRPSFGNYAYAPHYYDPGVLLGHSYSGLSLATDLAFSLIDRKTHELSAPLFLGEFGAPAGTRGADAYLTLMTQHLNRRFASGAQWNYTPGWDPVRKDGWNQEDLSIVDDRGTLRPGLFRPRPYPQRIAGPPIALEVREATAITPYAVEVSWDHVPGVGDTVIYAPAALFSGGVAGRSPVVTVEGSGLACRYDRESLRLTCQSATAGRKRVVVRSCVALGSLCL